MLYLLTGLGLVVHVLFWGSGLAALLMPRPWARCWLVAAAPAGLALQSLVVWAGAYADLPGTDSYAGWAEAIPALLLGAALWRRRLGLLRDVARFRMLLAGMALCLGALVLPLASGSTALTTASLGSCDAADYAGGARALKEFARSDRSGFLGLTEVVGVHSSDNFTDYWLRLNHFTPAALIAYNASVLGREVHEITGVLAAVLLVLSLPVVFWLARAVLRYGPGSSLWIALAYGFSPVTWYGVYHVALGQILAAMAVALLTWAGITLWRSLDGHKNPRKVTKSGSNFSWIFVPFRGHPTCRMFGVLFLGYALILGSYNFILLVCLVPAAVYVVSRAVWLGRWKVLLPWSGWMLLPLAAAGAVLADRVGGLYERFLLLRTYDFGWPIPALTPEGWLGMIRSTDLSPLPWAARGVLLAAILGAIALAVLRRQGGPPQGRPLQGSRQGGTAEIPFVALCLSVPILVGYAYLTWRGARLGTNASYDAYKLLAVFFPGLLAAACYWVTLGGKARGITVLLVVVVSAFLANGALSFGRAIARTPLVVTPELLAVGAVEQAQGVASVNVLYPDLWSRLWANALLLRKPQYFKYHTYEARRNTELRGEWDVDGGMVRVRAPGDTRDPLAQPRQGFSLLDTRSPHFLRVEAGGGWHDPESNPRTGDHWRWTRGVAAIVVDNPHAGEVRARLRISRVRSLVPRELVVCVAGRPVGGRAIGADGSSFEIEIGIPAGGAELTLCTHEPLTNPGNGDSRMLGFQVFGLEIEVLPAAVAGR